MDWVGCCIDCKEETKRIKRPYKAKPNPAQTNPTSTACFVSGVLFAKSTCGYRRQTPMSTGTSASTSWRGTIPPRWLTTCSRSPGMWRSWCRSLLGIFFGYLALQMDFPNASFLSLFVPVIGSLSRYSSEGSSGRSSDDSPVDDSCSFFVSFSFSPTPAIL